MSEAPQTLQIDSWTLKVQPPQESTTGPIFLLIHGWTGDENAMWVFASRLPQNAWMIAPRAPHPSPLGGYSWAKHKSGEWPWLADFRPSVEALLDLLETLPEHIDVDVSKVNLVGFSQGGTLAYSLALLHPERVAKVAGLASFLPERCQEVITKQPLAGTPIFVGHGTLDELVPVEMAHQAVEGLRQAGAQVSYCETEVGHKLGADCFNALEAFFS